MFVHKEQGRIYRWGCWGSSPTYGCRVLGVPPKPHLTPTAVESLESRFFSPLPVRYPFALSTGEMVSAIKGLFISCDVTMAQFIVNLNASMPASERFIVHMLVQPHVGEIIRSKIAEFRDQNGYEKPI